MGRALLLALAVAILGGCAQRVATPELGKPQVGIASWYGPGFHGRATTSGEIYDQEGLTAAHRSLPLGTRTRVTHLETGRSVDVRINDRGPFVKDRAIDLSYAAARVIDMVGPGTAPVRIDVLAPPPGGYSRVAYCVQAAALRERDKARLLRDDLARRYTHVYIHPVRTTTDVLYRVRVGPFRERCDAEARAHEMATLGYGAIVTEEPQP
jgi:rare lipoprotein A